MRRDFMADISHELRTPLAVLRGELEAIQDGVRQFTPESVTSLQAEVGTLTKLVDDLHQLSLSDEGALAYQKTTVDLVPLLEVAGGAFRERFTSRGLTLHYALPDSMTIFGDPDRLMQLFNNLLENSLRYTDSGGGLHISAEQRDKSLFLTFADSAPGVSDEQLQKLLTVFTARKCPVTAPAAVLDWGWQYASILYTRITVIFTPLIRLLAGLALQ